MISTDELLKIFRDKLEKTNSFDRAFTKAVWIAYKKGIEDGQSGLAGNSETTLGAGKLELLSRTEAT